MPTQFINLFCDYRNKELVVSNKSTTRFLLPTFYRQDKVAFKVQFVEPSPTGGVTTPFLIVDVTPISMQMAIGDGATPLATQLTWTKDEANNVFTAELDLNTTAMETALAAISTGAQLDKVFEILVTEGAVRHTIQRPCVIKKDVLYTGAPDPGTYEPPSALVANLVAILLDTDTIDWTQVGNTLLGEVKRKTGGGINKDSNGLFLDPFTELPAAENIRAGDAKTVTPTAGRRFLYHVFRVQGTGAPGSATVALSEVNRTSGDVIVLHFNCDDNVTGDVTITVTNSSLPFQFTAKVIDRNTRVAVAMFVWDGAAWILLDSRFQPFEYTGGPGNSVPKRTVMLDGDTMRGLLQFTGTTHAGVKLNSLTTAQRDALTPEQGMLIYNSDDDQVQGYVGVSWVNLGGGGGGTDPGRFIDAGDLNEGDYNGLDSWLDWHQTTFISSLVQPTADPATLNINIGPTGANEGDLIHARMDCTAAFAEVTTVNWKDSNTGATLVTFTSTEAQGAHFVGTFSYDNLGATWTLVSAHFEE